MENMIMNEKAKIANALKIYKEQITLHSDKIKGEILDFEEYEEAIEDDEDDLDYLKDWAINLIEEFTNFLIKHSIDYTKRTNN